MPPPHVSLRVYVDAAAAQSASHHAPNFVLSSSMRIMLSALSLHFFFKFMKCLVGVRHSVRLREIKSQAWVDWSGCPSFSVAT